jgi:hypothetical protein
MSSARHATIRSPRRAFGGLAPSGPDSFVPLVKRVIACGGPLFGTAGRVYRCRTRRTARAAPREARGLERRRPDCRGRASRCSWRGALGHGVAMTILRQARSLTLSVIVGRRPKTEEN